MEEWKIEEVARVLNEWNPLGDAAEKVKDLDSYRTEAIDIIAIWPIRLSPQRAAKIVMEVLTGAFSFYLPDLDVKDCIEPAAKISAILSRKR
jgi:hypothetical protein